MDIYILDPFEILRRCSVDGCLPIESKTWFTKENIRKGSMLQAKNNPFSQCYKNGHLLGDSLQKWVLTLENPVGNWFPVILALILGDLGISRSS